MDRTNWMSDKLLELNGFYNMDCMEGMKQFPDKYFELAIVDPPYGVNLSGGRGNSGWSNKDFWDKARDGWNLKVPSKEYFNELFRVSKNQIIWGGNYFDLAPSQCWLIWDKGQRNFSLADGEMAWTSFDKAMRIYTLSRAAANQEDKIHPTQKPVKLYEWLLIKYAKKGDKILDTHVGSASSLIACHELGFGYIGFELDADYFNEATERLEKVRSQMSLFDKPVDEVMPEGMKNIAMFV